MDSGHVVNTATVTGTAAERHRRRPRPDTTDTPIAAGPALTLDKQAGAPSGRHRGRRSTTRFLVTNTGNVTLTGVTVDDPLVGPRVLPGDDAGPGRRRRPAPATYTLHPGRCGRRGGGQHRHRDRHRRRPAADVTATGHDLARRSRPDPSIDAGQAGRRRRRGNAAGDTIDYTFLVTNTGNVTLDPVSIDDPTTNPVVLPGHHAGTRARRRPARRATRSPRPTWTPGTSRTPRPRPARTRNGTDVTATDSTDTPIAAGRASPWTSRPVSRPADTAGDTIDYTLPGHQHRQRDADRRHGRRPAGRPGVLPGDDARAGRVAPPARRRTR